jgi:hypothetical protein
VQRNVGQRKNCHEDGYHDERQVELVLAAFIFATDACPATVRLAANVFLACFAHAKVGVILCSLNIVVASACQPKDCCKVGENTDSERHFNYNY